MHKKIYIVALVAILVIAIGSYYFPQSTQQIIREKVIGAVATLDGVESGFMTINGNKQFRFAQPIQATSSVVCSLKNPYQATSSIDTIGITAANRGDLSAANNLFISTSSTAYGSSTMAFAELFAMGTGQFSYSFSKNVATSTFASSNVMGAPLNVLPGRADNGASNYILGPNEWITWRIATSTAGTFGTYMGGTCSAVVDKI